MRSIIFVTFLAWSFIALGQEPYLLHWTELDGLPDDRVNFCELDDQGYLWVTTYNGVARFDGQRFDKFQNEGNSGYSVNANFISHVKTMEDGKVWFSCYGGGISIYDPENRNFKYVTADKDTSAFILKESRVASFTEDGNRHVFTHYRGLDAQAGGLALLDLDGNVKAHYLSDVLEKYDLPIKFKVKAKDPYAVDTYWLPARKFYRWNLTSGRLDTFPYAYPENSWLDVKAVLFRNTEQILVAGLKGLYAFDRRSHQWDALLPDMVINFAALDNENRLWLTDKKGLGIYNFKRKKLEYIFTAGDKDSAFENGTRIIRFFFLNDFLWICTTNGLYAWHEQFEHIKSTTINHDKDIKFKFIRYVDSISPMEDLYLDKKGQICIVDPSYNLLEYYTINSTVHGHVYDKKNELLYIGADAGLFIWDRQSRALERFDEKYEIDGIESLEIWSVFLDDAQKAIWFGTKKNGLYKYDFQQKLLENFRNDPNNSKSLCFDRYIFKITKGPDENLWISTDKGISVVHPETGEFIIYPKIMDVLGDYIVHHTEVDDSSNIWIGTRDHGLYRFNPFTDEMKIYTIEHGLPFTGVNRIIHIDGKLIFSTRDGLCIKEDGSENIVTFGQSDGIINPNLYYPILNVNRANQLIFSNEGSQKINLLDLDHFRQEFDSLKLNIKEVYLFEDEKKVPYKGPLKDIRLNSTQNNFSIDFAGINFLRPQDVTYRYRLNGYDEKWIYNGTANSIIYTHIPGGNYKFEVQASTDLETWTSSQSLNILLQKHWYQTYLFKGIAFLLIVYIIYWFYNIQMEKVKIKESYQRLVMMAELKALRSQMNPHFLFNSLNSIKSFIAENDRRNASTYLNKFSMLMRLILNHSRQEVVTLGEEIKSLKLYIEMEKLRFEQLDYEININENIDLEQTSIQPMLIQPFVENAIWHGLLQKKGNGMLKLDFRQRGEYIDIIVEDNGVGRDYAKKIKSKTSLSNKSYGLKITQERLSFNDSDHENKLAIVDLFDKEGKACGTRVELSIKMA